jgi:hypothetical protein
MSPEVDRPRAEALDRQSAVRHPIHAGVPVAPAPLPLRLHSRKATWHGFLPSPGTLLIVRATALAKSRRIIATGAFAGTGFAVGVAGGDDPEVLVDLPARGVN